MGLRNCFEGLSGLNLFKEICRFGFHPNRDQAQADPFLWRLGCCRPAPDEKHRETLLDPPSGLDLG